MARRPQEASQEPQDTDAPRTEQITIAGQTFTVPAPFKEGDVLDAGAAAALNQVFHENIRNNKAKAVKAGEKSHEELQAEIDAYAQSYRFGVRTGGGGRVTDPVRKRAMEIIRGRINDQLKSKGAKASAEDIKAKVLSVIDDPEKGQRYMEMARTQLENERALDEEV